MNRRLFNAVLAGALMLTGGGIVGVATPASAAAADEDILARLKAVPGLTVLEERPVTGYRFFMMSITQLVDHRDPRAGTFQQRFSLLHKGTDRPMILHTTGYQVPDRIFRSEPAVIADGNQISVEQRFFTPSRPEPANWGDLDIWQAATDHHVIVQALKPIYTKKWISTGASKGGMTSIYHRRFYPSDVDGTVAYVAPQDVIEIEDSRYDAFFTRVGTAACRKQLDDIQIETFKRRSRLVPWYAQWAQENGRTFTITGNVDRAFEFMANGTTWAFWQYHGLDECADIPPVTASDDDLLGWIDAIYGIDSNTDQGIEPYIPYYFQASTQLGYPQVKLPQLKGLQRYPGQDTARSYIPKQLQKYPFQPFAMDDVDVWVKLFGKQLLFVYGQNDPWGAEPFKLGPGSKDSYWYVAPGANHGANIGLLNPADSATATAAVLRWANVTPVQGKASSRIPGLDDYNPALDPHMSL